MKKGKLCNDDLSMKKCYVSTTFIIKMELILRRKQILYRLTLHLTMSLESIRIGIKYRLHYRDKTELLQTKQLLFYFLKSTVTEIRFVLFIIILYNILSHDDTLHCIFHCVSVLNKHWRGIPKKHFA